VNFCSSIILYCSHFPDFQCKVKMTVAHGKWGRGSAAKTLLLLRKRKQCWGSMTFWLGSGSPDPYLLLMDPDSDPDTTPEPTPFFIDFKDAKKYFFANFFLITWLQEHHLQSKNYVCC